MTRIAFGAFVLDSGTRQLLREGRAVHLPPKAFQLLEALVENRPRALSKDDLHDRLWPDSFVVEANLANLVGAVRAALGDDPRRPRYIRTVHRFGYAFDAEGTGGEQTPAAAALRLTWKGGRTVLAEGEHVLGREPDLELAFDSATVSRRHARIRVKGGAATIEDLGSKNGTFVNDVRIAGPTPLADGDVILLGSVRLRFGRLSAGPTETFTTSRRP